MLMKYQAGNCRCASRRGAASGALCAAIAAACWLAGCSRSTPDAQPLQRAAMETMSATFYRVKEGDKQWIEVAIAVEGSKTFRMPVVFRKNGVPVEIDAQQERALLDDWLKSRAEAIAAFGTITRDLGQQPAVNIELPAEGDASR